MRIRQIGNLCKTKKAGGFTLIEATIALALWLILSLGVFAVWQHSARTSANTLARQNAFENARAAMDIITMNLQMSRTIRLETTTNDTLRRLNMSQRDPDGILRNYDMTFNYNLPPGSLRHNRLEFGLITPGIQRTTNEMAENIADIRIIYIEGSRMEITITTACETNPVILEGSVDMRRKTITVVRN